MRMSAPQRASYSTHDRPEPSARPSTTVASEKLSEHTTMSKCAIDSARPDDPRCPPPASEQRSQCDSLACLSLSQDNEQACKKADVPKVALIHKTRAAHSSLQLEANFAKECHEGNLSQGFVPPPEPCGESDTNTCLTEDVAQDGGNLSGFSEHAVDELSTINRTGVTTHQEGTEPGVVDVPAPRHKPRVMHSGSSRSLLSPINPLSSSAVVERVKKGLHTGGGTRPKVLLVGSGTFNPVHKLHIRRFFLARKFLEGDMGVSLLREIR